MGLHSIASVNRLLPSLLLLLQSQPFSGLVLAARTSHLTNEDAVELAGGRRAWVLGLLKYDDDDDDDDDDDEQDLLVEVEMTYFTQRSWMH